MSPSGLFIVSNPLPTVGESVVLKVHMPRGVILELAGTVVRQGRGSASIEGSAPFGFGFRITNPDEAFLKLFETL